ncbi:hypothetical protein BJ684DRAFT_19808 [Piptocephalis cylindrospora]|uniref:Essential protein Yae1 N-terminal domain-containing protein n=1 Tax=Piptocephalis cylindrospora TaxID=1907219 RepID=A0A4P9Y4V7_9FUNG|nr:hypothetical protein BJ684DRAFT_19808 [Piptocephalis cylindrospora]|eukprot:RKP13722.1 hypothetical protein BJ684DRAFT_19808 [Piptocephalis cylindrospora]
MTDPEFDVENLIHLEDMFSAHGREDGLRDGQITGKWEGQMLGCEKGFELARELGYYASFAETWMALTAAYPEELMGKKRAQRQLEALRQAALTLPLENAQDLEMDRMVEKARAKFRAATASLGISRQVRYRPEGQVQEPEEGEEGGDGRSKRPILSF